MTHTEHTESPDNPWVKKMVAAGWTPKRDQFGSIVQWQLYNRDVVISRADAEQYRRLDRTPPPF